MVELEPLFEPLPSDEPEPEISLTYFLLTPLTELELQLQDWGSVSSELEYKKGKLLSDGQVQMRGIIAELAAWDTQRTIVATDLHSQYPDESLDDYVLLHPDPTSEEVEIISRIVSLKPNEMIFPEVCYMMSLLALAQKDKDIPDPLRAASSNLGSIVGKRLNKEQFSARERLRRISNFRMDLVHQEVYAKERGCDGYEALAISDRALRGLRAKELLINIALHQ